MRVGSRQVLHLHQPSGPAPGTIRPIELEQTTDAVIITGTGLYRVVLFRARLCKLLPDLQHPLYVSRIAVTAQQIGYSGLCEA